MKLICPECRRENEPERVYCHECGARLDRSVLAKAQPPKDPREEQRRLKTMFNPSRGSLRRRALQFGRLLAGAIVLAVLVQMLRTPDLPEASNEIGLGSQINLDLENAAMEPRSTPLQYSEKAVNDYLAYVSKGKKKALSSYLDFERAVVDLEEGVCDLAVERSLFGFPLSTSIGFAPRIENDNVAAQVVSGRIGRMPIHPALMKYSGFLFADVRAAFDRERKSIAKLGAVEVHPDTVIFLPKPRP